MTADLFGLNYWADEDAVAVAETSLFSIESMNIIFSLVLKIARILFCRDTYEIRTTILHFS